MNVILIREFDRLNDHRVHSKRTKVERVLIVEDDGTEDGGREIAKIFNRDDALAIVKAMNWNVTGELG